MFVYYVSCLIRSAVFLIWIAYRQVRRRLYPGTDCLLEEQAG